MISNIEIMITLRVGIEVQHIINVICKIKNYKLPAIFHNLKGYDSHLIIKAFNNKNFRIDCIPTSTEKYLSFTILFLSLCHDQIIVGINSDAETK